MYPDVFVTAIQIYNKHDSIAYIYVDLISNGLLTNQPPKYRSVRIVDFPGFVYRCMSV